MRPAPSPTALTDKPVAPNGLFSTGNSGWVYVGFHSHDTPFLRVGFYR